jgi:hypothetical protein
MLSHANNGAVESCWWWRCWGDLATAWCRCWVMLAIVLPSHAGDGMALQSHSSDGAAKSCWWWRCWVPLATVLPSTASDGATESRWWRRCWVPLATTLLSPTGDGAAKATLVVAWCHCRGDLVIVRFRYRLMLSMSLPRRLGRGTMYLPSRAARPESRSTIGAVMCDRSRDVPTL